MDRHLERLIKYIRKEEVVLFIGAGFSIKAGAPRVQNIIDAICEEGGNEFAKEYHDKSLRTVSEAFVNHCCSRNDLISLLGKLFQYNVGDTTDQSLLRCIPHFSTIYTTNYDTLLEYAYPSDERIVITSNAGCSYVSDDLVRIYKIHGDITTLNNPDGIIITDSDYKHYFDQDNNFKLIWEALKHSFVEKHILFVGYSLEDDNVLEIIKYVRDCIGDSMKGMFLVAPNLSTAKKERLIANNVTYIDSDANSLLNTILSSIKDTIADDVKHKSVSRETYDKFCKINASIFTTIRSTESGNIIEKVDVKEGQKRDEKINFTIPIDKKDDILHLSYKDTIRIPGTKLDIPAIKIPSDEMTDFSHIINGIRFSGKTDISYLWIAPTVDKKTIKFKVPSIGFVETALLVRYKANGTFHIDIETPICIIKMEFDNPENGKDDIHTTIESKESYNNNNDALKWIECLLALSHEGQIAIIDGIELKVRHTDPQAISRYEKARGYYKLISQIESETVVSFESYNQYSDENYRNALYVYLLLSGQSFKIEQNVYPRFEMDFDTRVKDHKPISEFKKRSVMLWCTQKGDISLNNQSFNIPYVIYGFMDCKATSITAIDKFNYHVIMENAEKNYMIWCTYKTPSQEGNTLKIASSQKHIITIE